MTTRGFARPPLSGKHYPWLRAHYAELRNRRVHEGSVELRVVVGRVRLPQVPESSAPGIQRRTCREAGNPERLALR
ncbi:hypothetical protein GCM10009700_09010 [Brevibacterium sanguinis]